MYCQQILTQQWVGNTLWPGKAFFIKFILIFVQILLTPIIVCGHIVMSVVKDIDEAMGSKNRLVWNTLNRMKECQLFTNLDSPIHRCMSFVFSLVVMMFLLVETLVSPMVIEHYSKVK